MTLVHASAPLRISFAGGGTDVPPYPQRHGGAVLSATISWSAYASIELDRQLGIRVTSPDLVTASALDGRHELAQVVLTDDAFRLGGGAAVTLACDAPPGSGLGSSSSLIIAMAAALAEAGGRAWTPYELAAHAVRLEREDLGVPGGLQDQYAAVFGGFNFIEFGPDGVLVNPLRLRPEQLAELSGTLLLVPTAATSRRSSGILQRQIAQTDAAEARTIELLHEMKALAVEMKARLLRGDLLGVGELLHEGWLAKRALTTGITSEAIDALYDEARALGCVGGKLLGAGGGGYLLLMVPFAERGRVARELAARGHPPVSFSFTDAGVVAWRAAA